MGQRQHGVGNALSGGAPRGLPWLGRKAPHGQHEAQGLGREPQHRRSEAPGLRREPPHRQHEAPELRREPPHRRHEAPRLRRKPAPGRREAPRLRRKPTPGRREASGLGREALDGRREAQGTSPASSRRVVPPEGQLRTRDCLPFSLSGDGLFGCTCDASVSNRPVRCVPEALVMTAP